MQIPDVQKINAEVTEFSPHKLDLPIGDQSLLTVDPDSQLKVRGPILTDEGSFYEPFAGSSLSAAWTSITGTGVTLGVANSHCAFSTGTTANAVGVIYRQVDYPPLAFTYILSISQRIANQDTYFGYGDHPTDPSLDTMFARFHFYGTDAKYVSCETQSSADTGGNEGLDTQILIPLGLLTSDEVMYKIIHDGDDVKFLIGQTEETLVQVAEYSRQVPDPYTVMYQRVRFANGAVAPASTTTISVDTIIAKNYNNVDVTGRELEVAAAVTQSVSVSLINSTVAQLAPAAVFTGVGESTLGVAGIQVNFFSDQNSTVQCQQSMDNTNWDIVDSWRVFANQGDSRTFQATGSYFRMLVTNEGVALTTQLRMQVALCPIVEAVPRALSQGGGMFVTPVDDQNRTWRGKVTADGDLKTTGLGAPTITVRFAENFFDAYNLYDKQEGGGTRDTTLGQCTLSTVSGISSSTLWSKNYAYLSIQKLSTVLFTLVFDEPTLNNNTRHWGLLTPDHLSGIAFELLNGVLYAVAYFNGTATRTNIDFYKPTDGVMHRYRIQVTGSKALFFIDDNYICQIVSLLAIDHPIVSSSFLPVTIGNHNTASSSPCSVKIAGFAFYLSTATQNVITDPFEMTPVRVSKSGRLDVLPAPSMRFLAQFYDNTFDTSNIWAEVIVGSASKTVLKNMLTLSVTTGAADSITETTRTPIIPQTQTEVQRVTCMMNLGGFTDANNRREWGSKYLNDGNFFRCDGNEMYAVVLSNGYEMVQDLGPCGPLLDDKFHKFSIRRHGQVYTWFYVDDAQVAFFCASANQPLTYRVDDHPYLANYNTGITAIPLVLNCLGAYVADEASSTTAIQGADINGNLHNVTVDSQGRMTPAPFVPIQVGVTYLNNNQVDQITQTDQFGAVLTSTIGYNTNKRVTSIGQVLVE